MFVVAALAQGDSTWFIENVNEEVVLVGIKVGVDAEIPAVGLGSCLELAAKVAEIRFGEVDLSLERRGCQFVLLLSISGAVVEQLVRVECARRASEDRLWHVLRLRGNAGGSESLSECSCHPLDVERWLLGSLLVGLILISHSLSSCANDGGQEVLREV